MTSEYKTIHILLPNVHLDSSGESSSHMNAGRE